MKKVEVLLGIALICLTGILARDLYRNSQQMRAQREENAIREYRLADRTGELPARYDGRETGKNPTVKNQKGLGTCWAITATSAMESYFLPGQSAVFAADHLSLKNHFSRTQNDGGYYKMAMAYLAGWQGPVLEEEDPYGDGVSPDGLSPICHVQEMQLLGDKDYEAIKRAVYQYGAVQSSIYMDLENEFSTSVYYNQLEYSYYYDGEEKPNHDVLIIGWDDNYFPERFNRSTGRRGAFICQNSWGDKFGEEGIFYVSYDDVNIGRNSIAYTDIQPADNYDGLYETDLCGWVLQMGYGDGQCYFANVYTAQREETLEAVGFYATGADTRYELYIMEEYEDINRFAQETSVQRGTMEQSGYYTVELENPISLREGERFAVVVKIDTPDSRHPVAGESAAGEETAQADISDGEGYISHNGVVWERTEEVHESNVCLKAYTKYGG